ncbi:TniQ family protein [Methylorubrum thiocyanatum]|uniref:TniQ family protein n=1 Tax=Methylorubrum thiocyanatum TaxID=47958 RepID=UPI00383A615A
MPVEAIVLEPVPLRGGPYRDGEPAYGLFERLAKRAGVPPTDMARDHGLSWKSIIKGRAVDQVAALADVDPIRLRRSTPVFSSQQTVKLGDVVTDGRLWDHDRNVHCPECSRLDRVADTESVPLGARRRVWWDCLAIRFCHEHRLPLELRPPAEEEIEAAKLTASIPPDASVDATWEAYLVGRLGFGPRIPTQVLDELSVVDALVSAALFGWIALKGKKQSFDKTVAFLDADIFRRGFEILKYEDRLSAFLDARWLETSVDGARPTFKGIYGELHTYYSQGAKRPLGFCDENHAPLRNRVVEHALSRLPLDPNPKIFRVTYTGRGLPRMPETRGKNYAWESPFFRIAAALGLLDPSWAFIDCRMIGVPVEVIEQVDAFTASTCTGPELGKMLGLDSTDMKHLIATGRIVPVLRTNLSHFQEIYFEKTVAARFLDRLTRLAPAVSVIPADSLAFEEWRRRHRLRPIGVVEELLAGRVSAVGRLSSAIGLSGVLLPVSG